jgi:hypothetical protein
MMSMNMAVRDPIIQPVTIQGIRVRLSNSGINNIIERFNLNVSFQLLTPSYDSS